MWLDPAVVTSPPRQPSIATEGTLIHRHGSIVHISRIVWTRIHTVGTQNTLVRYRPEPPHSHQ